MKFMVTLAWVAGSIILLLWGGRFLKESDHDIYIQAMMLRFREQGKHKFLVKFLKVYCPEGHRVKEVLDLRPDSSTELKARDIFYKIMSFPLQGVCK